MDDIKKRLNLDYYKSTQYKNKYQKMSYVPIPKDVRWKAVLLALRDGQWTSIGYIQEVTGFSRKRVRTILKAGMQAGIIEKTYEESWQQPRKRAYPAKGNGWLYRRTAYYRLRLDKIKIKVTGGESGDSDPE